MDSLGETTVRIDRLLAIFCIYWWITMYIFSDVCVFIHSHVAAFSLEKCTDKLALQAMERDRFPSNRVMCAAFRIAEKNNRTTWKQWEIPWTVLILLPCAIVETFLHVPKSGLVAVVPVSECSEVPAAQVPWSVWVSRLGWWLGGDCPLGFPGVYQGCFHLWEIKVGGSLFWLCSAVQVTGAPVCHLFPSDTLSFPKAVCEHVPMRSVMAQVLVS